MTLGRRRAPALGHSPRLLVVTTAALPAFVVAAVPVVAQHAPPADAAAVVAALDSIGARPLWPGFDPRRIPLAIFDGSHTYLFRHGGPPPEFLPLPDADDVGVFPGRHAVMTANTWVELAGVPTATVLLDSTGTASALELAALAVHEAFHAFQGPRHPEWAANEAELFAYPTAEAELLAMRRLESDALRRSIATPNKGRAGCWARLALQYRQQRFRGLPETAVAYERGTELHEGLAQYVQSRALGMRLGRGIPADDFPPDAVRLRAYAVGEALALTLDRFDDEWKRQLEVGRAASLDQLLSQVLGGQLRGSCGYSTQQRSAARRQARDAVEAMERQRAAQREAFLLEPGWAVVVVVADASEPLWPRAFDPLNARTLGGGDVLHTRWLRLANESGTLEVLGRAALTKAAGAHPLFNGIREVAFTGFADPPVVRQSHDTVTIDAPGFAAQFRGVQLERADSTLTLRLGAVAGAHRLDAGAARAVLPVGDAARAAVLVLGRR